MSQQPQHATIPMRHIQEVVARRSGIPLAAISGESRHPRLIRARQAAAYLCRELTGRSLPEIDQRFGGRDHSTILYSIGALADRVREEPFIAVLLDEFRAEIHATPNWRARFKAEKEACAALAEGLPSLRAIYWVPVPLPRDE